MAVQDDELVIHAMVLRSSTRLELLETTDERTNLRPHRSGKPIDDEMIEGFADEADRGYEPGQLAELRRGPGRPPLGDAAKVVESVRLDPGLRVETAERAAVEGVTVSEIVRRALRQYLRSA